MKWLPMALIGGVSLLAMYAVAEAVWPASRLRRSPGDGVLFPEVTGANLEGKRYLLPGDFEGDLNLCLIAFTQQQQQDVDTWLLGLRPLNGTPGLEIYELPTIFRGTSVFRGWLDNAMRKGIPDRRQRERTITLYLDREQFRSSLGLPHEGTIYALLTDRQGRVLWRKDGRFSDAALQELQEILRGGRR